MPRLDRWLVDHGYFPSRQSAKRAIDSGYVLLNGMIPKPATKVRSGDEVHVSEHYLTRPLGYYKLSDIDSRISCELVPQGSHVLDIGSSAGGFLWYAHDQGATVIGVEISFEFVEKLRSLVRTLPKASIIMADAFTINPTSLAKLGTLDTLLIDVTTDWNGSLHLLQRFFPLLRLGGWFVLAIKIRPNDTVVSMIVQEVRSFAPSARLIVLSSERKEIHIVGTSSSGH
ncbi:MAG: S4 domain-containing protein [Candidatus Thorarchaeota archaeon]